MNAIIVDLDGTICDHRHRLHHVDGENTDWDAFHSSCSLDEPYIDVMEIIRELNHKYWTIICTGRTGNYQELTIEWLNRYKMPYDQIYMRTHGDNRPATELKYDMLNHILVDHHVIAAFEDSNSLTNMYRENGITCFQVREGDYS